MPTTTFARNLRGYTAYSEVEFGLIERLDSPAGEPLMQPGELLDLFTACARIEAHQATATKTN